MAETSRGATVRNVPGTRSEARRSERSVTFVTLGHGCFDQMEGAMMRDAISLKHYVDCCIGLDCRHTSAVAGCLKANTQPCQEVASCAVAGTKFNDGVD